MAGDGPEEWGETRIRETLPSGGRTLGVRAVELRNIDVKTHIPFVETLNRWSFMMPLERQYLPRDTALRNTFRPIWLATLSVLISVLTALAQEDSGAEPFAFDVGTVNQGLPEVEPPLRLETPRAALESFFDAVDANDRLRAAQALNLSGIPEAERAERGPQLAMQLAYLLLRYDLIDWSDVPDQPDARVLPDVQAPTSPYTIPMIVPSSSITPEVVHVSSTMTRLSQMDDRSSIGRSSQSSSWVSTSLRSRSNFSGTAPTLRPGHANLRFDPKSVHGSDQRSMS